MQTTRTTVSDNQKLKYFSSELIFLDRDYADTTAFFLSVYRKLHRQGYVRESFFPAIIQREQDYPTALPTTPFAIALPHTNPEHVIRPFISVTRLSRTISWREMGNNENYLQVSLVLLLGFIDHHSHLQLLQKLMECFADRAFLLQLGKIATAEALMCHLENKLNT